MNEQLGKSYADYVREMQGCEGRLSKGSLNQWLQNGLNMDKESKQYPAYRKKELNPSCIYETIVPS